ncbi:MAG: hypothetical protein IKD61_05640 [Oscillospiraceae bacterium]|nr:hypothetical protein [Oscillospiraceae bacterium]
MNEARFYAILTIIVFVICIGWIVPTQERKKKAAKEAAMIASRFDSYSPTLYVFEGKGHGGREEAVFALLSRGYYGNMYEADTYYEMAHIYGQGKNGKISDRERKKTMKEVDYTLSLLPFHVYHCTTFDSWSDYLRKRKT